MRLLFESKQENTAFFYVIYELEQFAEDDQDDVLELIKVLTVLGANPNTKYKNRAIKKANRFCI